jgi:hypothetical protein
MRIFSDRLHVIGKSVPGELLSSTTSMMSYHDGLRTITAEHARHSSKIRAPLSDLLRYLFLCTYSRSILYRYHERVTLHRQRARLIYLSSNMYYNRDVWSPSKEFPF